MRSEGYPLIEPRYPIRIEFEAYELEDGNWRLTYREYFKKEDLDAFREGVRLLERTPFSATLDEKRMMIEIRHIGPREVIFDGLCGEFLALSGFAQKTLLELFVLASLGEEYFKEMEEEN